MGMLLHIPQTATQFASYGMLKDLHIFEDKTLNAGFSGMVAGIFSKLTVQPLDTVRKRLQVNGLSRHSRYGEQIWYDGILHCICTMYASEGLLGFYKGLLPNLLKMAPATAI